MQAIKMQSFVKGVIFVAACFLRLSLGFPYCPRYECDYFVECFLAGQGLSQNATGTILIKWQEYRKLTCDTNNYQFHNDPMVGLDLRQGEALYCQFMLQTAEVQLDFLKQGVPKFPDKFFMVRHVGSFNAIKETTGGCWLLSPQTPTQAAVIDNAAENSAIACAGNYTTSRYVAFNLTSNNKTYPTDPASYENPTNKTTKLPYTNWATPLTNQPNWACAAVNHIDGMWTNRKCDAPLDVACTYMVALSPVVQLMQQSQVGPADPTSMLQIENNLRDIAVNQPDLVGAGLLELDNVQLQITIENRTSNQPTYQATLLLQFGRISYTLFLNQTRRKQRSKDFATPVMAFPRNISQSLDPGFTDGMVSERLVSPDTIGFITVSGWYDKNESYEGIADLFLKPPDNRGACKDLLFPNDNSTTGGRVRLSPVCAFIDRRTKKYSTAGCVTTIDDVTGDVRCACNHLTMFAVLLAVRRVVVAESVRFVSYGTEAASICCLIVTIAILVRYKNFIKGDRTSVQINLSVALLLLHVINLFHDLALKQDQICVIHTVINHFLLLSTGCWMMVEGIRIFMATSDPVGFKVQNELFRYRVFLGIGWGIPAAIVVLSIAVGIPLKLHMTPQSLYTQCHQFINATVSIPKYDRCWLAPGTPIFYSTVVAPLSLILLFNFVIAVKTSVVMLNSKRMQNRNQGHSLKDISRAAKSLVFLFLMLGATWCLGFFTGVGNEITSLVFLYINAVVNGAQGIVVFILYCIMNDVIREKLFPPKPKKAQPPGGVASRPRAGHKGGPKSASVCTIRDTEMSKLPTEGVESSPAEALIPETQTTKT